jgi:hypothetical protein
MNFPMAAAILCFILGLALGASMARCEEKEPVGICPSGYIVKDGRCVLPEKPPSTCKERPETKQVYTCIPPKRIVK